MAETGLVTLEGLKTEHTPHCAFNKLGLLPYNDPGGGTLPGETGKRYRHLFSE